MPAFELSIKRQTRGPSSVESTSCLDKSVVSHLTFPLPFRMSEALRNPVNHLNQLWMDKLRGSSYGCDVRFCLFRPFEEGIQSLQDFSRGILPRTFEGIFALMHIVYACVSVYPQNDERHFWHTFSLDVLLWQHAIATQDERELFLEAAVLLWWVPDLSLDEANEHFDAIQSQPNWSLPESYDVSGNPSSLCLNYYQQSTPQAFDSSIAPFYTIKIDFDAQDLVRLHNKLKEGQAIDLCMRYLDGKLLLSMKISLTCLELKVYRSST